MIDILTLTLIFHSYWYWWHWYDIDMIWHVTCDSCDMLILPLLLDDWWLMIYGFSTFALSGLLKLKLRPKQMVTRVTRVTWLPYPRRPEQRYAYSTWMFKQELPSNWWRPCNDTKHWIFLHTEESRFWEHALSLHVVIPPFILDIGQWMLRRRSSSCRFQCIILCLYGACTQSVVCIV